MNVSPIFLQQSEGKSLLNHFIDIEFNLLDYVSDFLSLLDYSFVNKLVSPHFLFILEKNDGCTVNEQQSQGSQKLRFYLYCISMNVYKNFADGRQVTNVLRRHEIGSYSSLSTR